MRRTRDPESAFVGASPARDKPIHGGGSSVGGANRGRDGVRCHAPEVDSTSMSFPRRPAARATFVSVKVAKTIRAERDGLADVVSARLPLLLALRAPARTRASLRSNSRALLARSASSPRHRDSAGAHFDTAIHGLRIQGVMSSASGHCLPKQAWAPNSPSPAIPRSRAPQARPPSCR